MFLTRLYYCNLHLKLVSMRALWLPYLRLPAIKDVTSHFSGIKV